MSFGCRCYERRMPRRDRLTTAQQKHLVVVRAEVSKALAGEKADLALIAQFLDEIAHA